MAAADADADADRQHGANRKPSFMCGALACGTKICRLLSLKPLLQKTMQIGMIEQVMFRGNKPN